jgi:hypothetical protein
MQCILQKNWIYLGSKNLCYNMIFRKLLLFRMLLANKIMPYKVIAMQCHKNK